jgi:hypothetical protein
MPRYKQRDRSESDSDGDGDDGADQTSKRRVKFRTEVSSSPRSSPPPQVPVEYIQLNQETEERKDPKVSSRIHGVELIIRS